MILSFSDLIATINNSHNLIFNIKSYYSSRKDSLQEIIVKFIDANRAFLSQFRCMKLIINLLLL